MEAVYWHNVTLKDDTTASTAPANLIHAYEARINSIDIAPPREHTNHRFYKVGDALWVKTHMVDVLYNSQKGKVTGVYCPHSILVDRTPRHIRDLCPRLRSPSLEDDDSDKSTGSDSNAPLFFNVGPDDSSVEPKEMDSEENNDDAKNEKGQGGITGEEMGESHPPLHRNTWRRWLPSPCHLCDQGGVLKRRWLTSCNKASTYMPGVQNERW